MDYVQALVPITLPTHLPDRAVTELYLLGAGIGLVTDVPLCQPEVFLILLSEVWSLQLPQRQKEGYCGAVTALTTAKCQREVSETGSVGHSLFFCLSY